MEFHFGAVVNISRKIVIEVLQFLEEFAEIEFTFRNIVQNFLDFVWIFQSILETWHSFFIGVVFQSGYQFLRCGTLANAISFLGSGNCICNFWKNFSEIREVLKNVLNILLNKVNISDAFFSGSRIRYSGKNLDAGELHLEGLYVCYEQSQ